MDDDSAVPSYDENGLLNEDESVDSDGSQQNLSAALRRKSRRSDSTYRKRKKAKSKSTGHQNSFISKSKLNYKCSNFIKEDHKQPIFGCQFYQHTGDPEDDPLLFATVGSNRVSVYRCGEDCGRMNLYQSYADADPEEIFYSCTWTTNEETGHPLLCFAGAKGIIHVLDPIIRQFVRTFQGHGAAVNEIKTHPIDSTLIISTSKDHTIRLWNIKTECCVAIFAGVEGHRDEVLGIDFDIMGQRIVTCGMDHSLKFWSLEKDRTKKAIEDSHSYSIEENRKTFPTLAVHYPEFTTRDVHRNYVDCCVWLGDLVLSKSCDNQVVCWKPKEDIETIMRKKNHKDEVGVFVLHKFDITDCDIWFIRFAVDCNQSILALGNQVGKIMLYELQVEHPANGKATTLHHSRCTTAIRQISFNASAKILIAVCDDGSVWRWDKQT